MTHTRLAPAALLLAATSLFAAPPDVASVSGIWKITGDVHGRPVDMTCQLAESNSKVSGSCKRASDDAQPHQVDGTVNGQKLQFQLQTALGSRPITLIVSGKLNQDGSHVAGDLDVEPLGVGGKFQGEREASTPGTALAQTTSPGSAAATSAPQSPAGSSARSSQTADGTWAVDADFQGTTAQLTCTLKQDGAALTGTCTGEDTKPNPINGEVNERGLTWHFDTQYQGQPITVTMNAKLNADGTMQGAASVAPLNADGTFTAKRQAAAPAQPSTSAPSAGTPPVQ